MRCPNCGFESINAFNECPNCHFLNANNATPVVQVNQENVSTQNIDSSSIEPEPQAFKAENVVIENEVLDNMQDIKNEVVSSKKDMSKVYYIILAIAVIIFLVLMSIVISKNLKKDDKIVKTNSTAPTSTTEPKEEMVTKNKGVYSNLITPVNVGEITYGGLLDIKSGKIVDVDVQVLRHLSDEEMNSIIAMNNQTLYPGFRWDGVEYSVTLNDFDYLGDEAINPLMKTYLFDTYYKNNFFLVDENYYTIDPIYDTNVALIKNGESALLHVVYQVPSDQSYYVCFGENFSSLGCFNNF